MKIEFEIGEILTPQEMYTRLQVSKCNWENNRARFLDNLQLYYTVKVIGYGRSRKYQIIEKLGDYEPPMTTRSRQKM